MTLLQVSKLNEDQAREYLEKIRWPEGVICPKCGNCENIYTLKGKSTRLLAHLNGDNSCITGKKPNQWTAEILQGDPTSREKQLILEYDPPCNKKVG